MLRLPCPNGSCAIPATLETLPATSERRRKNIYSVGPEVLIAVNMNGMVFWVVTLCSLGTARHCEGIYHLHLQGRRVK
jgi:hypothetical protein